MKKSSKKKTSTNSQDVALLFLRILLGVIFLYAGIAKIGLWFSTHGMSGTMLELMKFLSLVESLGGLALLLGLFTRRAATGLAIIMAGAVLFMQAAMQAPFFTSPQGSGLDHIMLILASCVVLMVFGAGEFSLDAKVKEI